MPSKAAGAEDRRAFMERCSRLGRGGWAMPATLWDREEQGQRTIPRDLDVLVPPSSGGHQPLIANPTGHPTVILPDGVGPAGAPTFITFIGRWFGDSAALAAAGAYQDATDFHTRRPPRFA
jgi:hypothetical protein